MSVNPKTRLPEEVNDTINKPEIVSAVPPPQNGCPIAREITHRLQIPPVVGKSNLIYIGSVSLSRHDFCPESAYCVLCRFVAKVRPAGTNEALLGSVHFVLNEFTNRILRRWMDTQFDRVRIPVDDLAIVVTSGANVFHTVHYQSLTRKTFQNPKCGPDGCILGTLCLWGYQVPNCNPSAPKFDILTYITNRAKQWLRLCDDCDEVCKSLISTSTPQICLIDCSRHCLVHGFQGIRYVALSYVWGKTGRNFNLPERKYGVPLDGLPRTISDAIMVTKSLGYNYLWVDMLCIDQQSEEDKHRQIAIMDQIYRSADLTIIVAAGNDCGDGIPGVSVKCRLPRLSTKIGNTILVDEEEKVVNEFEASIWRSRGWTFQEGLLSRRRLVFTDSQMVFSCLSGQAMERREGPEYSHHEPEDPEYMRQNMNYWDTSVLQTDDSPRTTLRGDVYGNTDRGYGFPISFAELLEKYSTLNFSFESDILNAFRAIGNVFALRTPPVLHLYGLPFIFDNESTTASSLTRGLAWCLERGNEDDVRRPGFPSWSWLGYRGPVRWGAILRDDSTLYSTVFVDTQWTAKTFSHVKSMITNNNKRFALLELLKWWREWNSAKPSEGLAPSSLMISGPIIRRKAWLGTECTLQEEGMNIPAGYIITGKGACFSNFQYSVGENLGMSADACTCLLENLRRGTWRALLLTDQFLLIIQSVAADAESGPYRRVASSDVDVFHKKKLRRLERDRFVRKYTDLVEIELL